MEIEDLSMSLYFDYDRDRNFKWLSVGWLGNSVRNPRKTPLDIILKLKWLKIENGIPCVFLGLHTCELCYRHSEGSSFWVGSDTKYLLPKMVIHYIEERDYYLPSEVMDWLYEFEIPAKRHVVSHEIDTELMQCGFVPIEIFGNCIRLSRNCDSKFDINDLHLIFPSYTFDIQE